MCLGYNFIRFSKPQVGRLLSFFSSHWNWDAPTPSPAGEPAPPPFVRIEGHTRLREKEWGSPNSDAGTYSVVLYSMYICICV